MRRLAVAVLALALVLAAAGCRDDGGAVTDTTTSVAPTTVTTTDLATTTTTSEPSTTTTAPASSGVTVLFPDDDTRFGDPAPAADGFMHAYFPTTAYTLGPFEQGDTTSGEIPVLGVRPDGRDGQLRSTLLLREVDEAWYVIGAASEFVTIEEPAATTVVAGPVTVSGRGRGFEATLAVRAVAASAPFEALGQGIGSGGSAADPLPYSVDLDLSAAEPGLPVAIIVQGGTGLDGDPGEFSVAAVVIRAG